MTWTLNNYDRLLAALGEHVMLVGIALALSLAMSLPLGIWSARAPRIPRRLDDEGPRDLT